MRIRARLIGRIAAWLLVVIVAVPMSFWGAAYAGFSVIPQIWKWDEHRFFHDPDCERDEDGRGCLVVMVATWFVGDRAKHIDLGLGSGFGSSEGNWLRLGVDPRSFEFVQNADPPDERLPASGILSVEALNRAMRLAHPEASAPSCLAWSQDTLGILEQIRDEGRSVLEPTATAAHRLEVATMESRATDGSVRIWGNEPWLFGTMAGIFMLIVGSVYILERLLTKWSESRRAKRAATT